MKAVLCFSPGAAQLAKKHLADFAPYGKAFGNSPDRNSFGALFRAAEALVFIGAAGIAVRYIAPWLADKRTDPAVVVIDPAGRYVIPILSGHLGGANALAKELAERLSAEAVLTTASDVLGYEAPDLFAQKRGYVIDDMAAMRWIAARMVAGEAIYWYSERDAGPQYPHLIRVRTPEEADRPGGVVVSERDLSPEHALKLVPRCVHLGVGSKKGTTEADLMRLLENTLDVLGLDRRAIRAVHTIDIKRKEPSIVAVCEELGVSLYGYSAAQLSQNACRCSESDFVKRTVGVGNVSCSAALMGGSELLAEKIAERGFTLSVTREEK
ncbi:cobalamin biosynthesis protein CbiG [Aedoeadaptatus ivorii]|uniref:Cobalamin biosynthesis protein CbiG n=1 Tax=Aedoeadaptatus ivorii TaxID=54006 RepID=A0A3S4ZQG5_9FIRM|nr:cobalt-precorrin 5A hydrolase [Peptoniphilus ivorii]VEJ35447.1 cobalamin biosynthesis protein CbiG [Peptoniphilus ivorii]